MKHIMNFLRGMIIGVANIIPGISGGTLMITLGIYREVIETISHFFMNFKKNIIFILPIGLGMIASILLLSKVISYSLSNYPFPTTFFFVGLIIGGIPLIWNKVSGNKRKVSNWTIFLITFSIVLTFAFLKNTGSNTLNDELGLINYLSLFFIGMVSASTMIIPGISGSFVLMLLGYYEIIINTLKDLTNFNLLGHNMMILIPFGLGIVVGIIGVAKLVEWLFKKYSVKTYYGVLGFVIASIIAIIKPLINNSASIIEIIISIILLIVGAMIAYKLGQKN